MKLADPILRTLAEGPDTCGNIAMEIGARNDMTKATLRSLEAAGKVARTGYTGLNVPTNQHTEVWALVEHARQAG